MNCSIQKIKKWLPCKINKVEDCLENSYLSIKSCLENMPEKMLLTFPLRNKYANYSLIYE